MIILSSINDKKVVDLCLKNQRIGSIIFHSAKSDKKKTIKENGSSVLNIINTTQKINSCEACGVIDKKYFVLEQSSFIESLSFNSCLNEKVSVDENGFIKNCPSMKKDFGNIKNKYNFNEIVEDKNFKEYWRISKDKIKECKVCEYRHICQDCRAYTQNSSIKTAKPLKCNYNPIEGVYND